MSSYFSLYNTNTLKADTDDVTIEKQFYLQCQLSCFPTLLLALLTSVLGRVLLGIYPVKLRASTRGNISNNM